MSTESTAETHSSTDAVTDLLEQRARIQSWLDNLHTVGAEANSRVVDRVRSDYQRRLGTVLDELAEHLESIRSDRETRQKELTAASKRLEEASEELEEARLRHMIGELSDEEWRKRQPDLGDAVTEAEADREDARAEVERLDQLLRQLEADGKQQPREEGQPRDRTEDEPETAAGAALLADSVEDLDAAGAVDVTEDEAAGPELPDTGQREDDDSDLRIVHSPDPLAFLAELPGSEDATVEQPEPAQDDDDFLRDLDRAIGGDANAAQAGSVPPDEEDPEQFRPTPGTKCPECGYTNDPEAWYCGVCGVDLA